MTLEDLAKKYSNLKGDCNHGYMDEYEKYFAPIRESVRSIFEIGVASGSSLQIWKEYFPNARVYGLDIQPDCMRLEDGDRMRIFIGRQENFHLLNYIASTFGPFDIIIDDGGHVLHDQICSLLFLIKHIKSGGYYFIEDVFLGRMDTWSVLMESLIAKDYNLEALPVFFGKAHEQLIGFKRR